ncbi:hypothetical protein KY308_01260, partial [Candidatus Woesearchaeota archaeon]|nr:hypothetical protein [Candidatus Woesearchaeota archaeon]
MTYKLIPEELADRYINLRFVISERHDPTPGFATHKIREEIIRLFDHYIKDKNIVLEIDGLRTNIPIPKILELTCSKDFKLKFCGIWDVSERLKQFENNDVKAAEHVRQWSCDPFIGHFIYRGEKVKVTKERVREPRRGVDI